MLKKILAKKSRTILGINSGTSMDGVDLALVQFRKTPRRQIKLLSHATVPYPDGLRNHIFHLIANGSTAQWSQLDALLGHVYADAAMKFLNDHSTRFIDAIGLHGQTVFHHPECEKLFGYDIHSTWQIGDPDVVAKKTGVVTVSHFRNGDVGEGGSGAPLVPVLDLALFRHPLRNRVILNLGGIANLTVIERKSKLQNLLAFDTGPGNVLIDHCSQMLYGRPYDEGGRFASRGTVRQSILDRLMDHPYFQKTPPKSTGRETFGSDYLSTIEKRFEGVDIEDVMATVTEFTVASIADQLRRYVPLAIDEMIVSGGGAKNSFLLQRLRERCNVPIVRSDELGVPSHAKEAMLFAYLADAALSGAPANVPSVTGARRFTVIGRISQP